MMITEEWNDKPTGSSDKRADLPSPLGAVAMRDAVIALAKGMRIDQHSTPEQNLAGEYYDDLEPAIEAIPLPDHADMLAAALKLPEVAAICDLLREAAGDLTEYVDAEYPLCKRALYPAIAKRHFRDMELVRRINAALEAKP